MGDEILASRSELEVGSVHVWAIPIRAPDEVTSRFERFLTFDERERAAQFRFRHLERSFVLTRGALRLLLGAYLHAEPSHLELRYGSKGKPTLPPPALVNFNVSHSGNLALYSFMIGADVGIDVEQIRPLSDIGEIASRFFCAEEAAELLSLPLEQRELAFFLCWTRKEAYIKAIGDGLSVALDDFRVSIQPGEPARLLHVANDVEEPRAWTIHDLALGSEYAAALAYRGESRSVRMRSLADAAELFDYAPS